MHRVIQQLSVDLTVPEVWEAVANCVQQFADGLGAPMGDVVVLLPFAQHLPLARAAWTARVPNGWAPRFETTRTFADSMAPALPATEGAPCFDAVLDRLQAARMLSGSVPDWPRRDPRGFDLAVRRVVGLSQSLAEARAALPPSARPDWIASARERLPAIGGPAAGERVLARLALEWSLDAATGWADALFTHRPAAWVALQAGACDALTESLLASSEVPMLRIAADRPPTALPRAGLVIAACDDFEDEAQRAAAAVLAHLERGIEPHATVALIALDRVLVRRVRALLERQHVPVADETGWKLSTTRAAARVLGLLKTAALAGGTDGLLDLLKSLPGAEPGRPWAQGLDGLEVTLRRKAWTDLQQVDREQLPTPARAAWDAWWLAIEPLRESRRASLARWLARLTEALRRSGLLEALAADSAGAQVLAALRCGASPSPGPGAEVGFASLAEATDLTAGGFLDWVDGVLEQVSFRPPPDAAARVVITPLERAWLRPFCAIVCPGADAVRLGASASPEPLLGDALAVELGVAGVTARRDAERLAFAQLGRTPRLTLLYRRADGSELIIASPLVRRWQLAAARQGRIVDAAPDPRVIRLVAPCPTPRPMPVAPALLPERYSASSYEHLRACPYRFYAAAMLRLDEVAELDDELEKREVGTWLHRVLHRFHAGRAPDSGRADDLAALLDVAAQESLQCFGSGAAAADFLPFEAGFAGMAPAYVDWLHGTEAEGWRVRDLEHDVCASFRVEPQPVVMKSRLDRVDCHVSGSGGGGQAGERYRLIDYKLKGKAAVQAQVRVPLEDTQLAFYAALLATAEGWPPGGLEAGYLALDGREGPVWVAHKDVADSAQALLDGLARDVSRLRQGAPLPALGEGAACEHCAARGLCRRDHWRPA